MEIQFNENSEDKGYLIKFALDELGLTLTKNMRPETMVQRIKDQAMNLAITLIEPVETPPHKVDAWEKAGKGPKGGHGAKVNWNKDEWPTIVVSKVEGKFGGQPIVVGYNAKLYSIPRGIPVKVPPSVEEILRVAIKTSYDWDEETMELVPIDGPAYAYQVVAGFEFTLAARKAMAKAKAEAEGEAA